MDISRYISHVHSSIVTSDSNQLTTLSASTAATYVFTALTCTTTIITLEPCALNAESQDFTKFPYFADLTQRGDSG
jgi:hypothetical protein